MSPPAAALDRPSPDLAELLAGARARVGVDPLGEAFAQRRAFPWFGKRPALAADPETTWRALLARPRRGKSVAYVHVPFCIGRCLFCGFYRNHTDKGFSAPYARAVAREMAIDAERPMIAGGPIHALYFGGGTPTALAAEDLAGLMGAARRHLPLAADCEITVEGRVFDFDLEKARACVEAGANRFSIGIQTFDGDLRKRLGRRADREGALAFLADLVGLDQAAVVIDLIYGLPGQSLETWRAHVESAAAVGLDGVDLYRLSLYPDSPLEKAIARGKLPTPPELPEQGEMYGLGVALLEAAGWRRLSQAHFARATRERNLYNQLTKTQADSLAYGAGAGGLMAGYRYRVGEDLDTYQARTMAGEKPLDGLFLPAADLPIRRVLTTALENGRIVPAELAAVAGLGFETLLTPLLEQWGEAGLLTPVPGALGLTTAGWFWQSTLNAALHDLMVTHQETLPQPQDASA